jgi:hypothetical protein
MGLFGSPKNVNATTYYSLNIQTSLQGIGIPVVMGANRIGCNLIWYNDFSRQSASGKGSGKGGKSGDYTYSASIIFAICEGPIAPITTCWSEGNPITLDQLGLTFFSGTESQAPWSYVVSNHPTQAMGYTHTAYVCAANYALGSSAQPPNIEIEARGFFFQDTVTMNSNGSEDVNIAQAAMALLVNDYWGLGLPTALAGNNAAMISYCRAQSLWISPVLKDGEQVTSIMQRWAQLANSWIFWDGTQMQWVPLGTSTITGNGTTYTPNRSVQYNLTLDDFLVDEKDETAVAITVDILDPADGYNQMQLDINDRGNAYNNTPIVWFDQYLQDLYGNLPAQTISASEVCSIPIANTMVALIGKRNAYIRNNYTFKLSERFAWLIPGDVVTLTEPRLGFNQLPVAITDVSGDNKDVITFKAEEFPYGANAAEAYSGSPGNESDGTPNQYVAPGSVNTPAFYEPLASVTGGNATIDIALSGGEWWGGCGVFISFDDVNYSQIGTCATGSIQGTLTATLPISSSFDTTTLQVDTSESYSTPSAGVTDADSIAARTLVVVDAELLAYGTSTPGTATYDTTLGYLNRGLYNSGISSHSSGASFSVLDPTRLFSYNLPQSYTASTIYFKFPSVNVFGLAAQDLSECTTYTYTVTGSAYTVDPPTGVTLTVIDGIVASVNWTPTTDPRCSKQQIEMSYDGQYSWSGTLDLSVDEDEYTPSIPGSGQSPFARVRSCNIYNNNSTWVYSTPVYGPGAPATSITTLPTPSVHAVISVDPPTYLDNSITQLVLYKGSGSGTITSFTPYTNAAPPSYSDPSFSAFTTLTVATGGGAGTINPPSGPSGTYATISDSAIFTRGAVGSVGNFDYYYWEAINAVGSSVGPMSGPISKA